MTMTQPMTRPLVTFYRVAFDERRDGSTYYCEPLSGTFTSPEAAAGALDRCRMRHPDAYIVGYEVRAGSYAAQCLEGELGTQGRS